MEGDDPANQG